MACDFMAHRASQICGMVVTAVLFVVPWLYIYGRSSKNNLVWFMVSISVMAETNEVIFSNLIGQSLQHFVPYLVKSDPALPIICKFLLLSAAQHSYDECKTVMHVFHALALC